MISLTASNSYEVTSTKFTRDLSKELLVSLFASVFMGFGVLFLLLWVGIYVWGKKLDVEEAYNSVDSQKLRNILILCGIIAVK